jgi:hypothetical protein
MRLFGGAPQDRLAGIDIATQHRIDAFAKQGLGEFLVGLDPHLHQFPEAFCFGHGFVSVQFRPRLLRL